MSLVTFFWSLTAALALMMALACVAVWLADRRDLAKLMFCVTALATAAASPLEVAMMQAATAAELGAQLRWYHLPIFFVLLGQGFFVRHYLGTGRSWLLWTFVALRVFVLVANFLVLPNFNFSEIASLNYIEFLGERVSVVGEGTPRTWQWVAASSMLLLVAFIVDATIQAWRTKDRESRRRALIVGAAMILPMVGNVSLNQMVVSGYLHIPICATLWLLGTLTVIALELGRELVLSGRARLQLAELRNQWAQVERVNSLGQLASALTHELGQPLSSMRINVDLARTYLGRPDPDLNELRVIIEDVDQDTRRTVDIIERMRAFIKGRMTKEPFDLNVAARDVFSLLHHEATSHQIELKCDIPADLPAATGDRVHISQVILNLLINGMHAVRSLPPRARRVTLEARKAAQGENLEVTVRDSGPGVPDDRLEQIFDPFFTTKTEGLGVGLALSRMIVQAHGGRLWAENSESGGAVFRFTLPRQSTNA